jgi:hypothetical protein
VLDDVDELTDTLDVSDLDGVAVEDVDEFSVADGVLFDSDNVSDCALNDFVLEGTRESLPVVLPL